MKPVGTKPITTARLHLRAPLQSDAAALREAGALAMSADEAEKAVAQMVREQKMPFVFHWVITLEGRPLGRVKGWEVNPYNGYVQLGYDIGPAWRGRGYMTEAVRAVIRYLLREAQAHRVYGMARESNMASRRVMEKCGMQHEGVMRGHFMAQDGSYDDVHIYGILADDLKEE